MEKVTELLLCELVSRTGVKLGRVYELRCPGEPEHGIPNRGRVVRELFFGTRGLLEVLGLRETRINSVPWSAVRDVRDGTITIDESQIRVVDK
jgi:hypothetical protein